MSSEVRTDLAPMLADREAADLAELLQALGDPVRLRILSVLDTACAPVGAIAAATGLRQSAVSHHLRVLRDRGILIGERRGTFVYYCATSNALRPALEAVRTLLAARSPQ
jgi:ArsR family transcriptional regulator